MAKQTGPIPLSGTLGGVTFYNLDGKNYARLARQLSKRRMKQDPAFARTRENSSEFGQASKAGALFRKAFKSQTKPFSDMHYCSRVVTLMMKLRGLDQVSVRGERKVSEALQSPEGRALLDGFNFHATSFLQAILLKPYTADATSGVVSFTDLVTDRDLILPRLVTHVEFSLIHAIIDFEKGKYVSSKEELCLLPIDAVSRDLVLRPKKAIKGAGVGFLTLRVQFFRIIDEEVISLKGSVPAMQLVALQCEAESTT